ncbi:MAG: MgtC/SapB family protein [Candidatus Saganbacteria bacterium]|nr:MgtC/SapB family protein [Candidatus Saganbacteria bacterium]
MNIPFLNLNDIQIMTNLVLALALGGLIGYFREKERKVAGLRTHTLVAIGSCLAMQMSIYMAQLAPGGDPGRIAAGVVAGIGFLGAGAIFQAGGSVIGLTTAASIWGASMIGMAVGCNFYMGAIAATVFILFTLQILREVEHKYIHKEHRNE